METKDAVKEKPKMQETKKEMEAVKKEQTGVKTIDKFVYMEETAKVLDIGIATGQNVVLYGKGGFGKSEFSLAYLREKGIEPFVFTMGSGTSTDRLFGGIDLKLFNETGKIEYNVENSFMNYEYVIFEEMFDAPDFILEQLKDIISSGYFRNGSQQFKIKTKFIIACTNKKREDFIKNDSLKALTERFPLEHKVEWKVYNSEAYDRMLEKIFDIEEIDPALTYLFEKYHEGNKTISPRIAIAAAKVLVSTKNIEDVLFIADMASGESIFKAALKEFKDVEKYKMSVESLISSMKNLDEKVKEYEDTLDSKLLDELEELNTKAEKKINTLKKFSLSDKYDNERNKIVKKLSDKIKKFRDFVKDKKIIDDLENINL